MNDRNKEKRGLGTGLQGTPLVWQGLLLVLFHTGLGLALAEAFPDAGLPGWGLALIGVLMALLLLCLMGVLPVFWVFTGWMGILTLVSVVAYSPLRLSMGNLENALVSRLIQVTGQIYLPYEAASNGILALVILTALCALLSALAVRCSYGGLWLLVYLPLGLLVFLGSVSRLPALGLLLLALFWYLGMYNGMSGAQMGARLLVLAGIGAICFAVTMPFAPKEQDSFWKSLTKKMHALRYDSDSNSMPEGNLAEVASWEKSESPALQVTMESPQKLYLRGKIYDDYQGTAWGVQEAETPTKDSALFYWLHEEGLYGQTQLAQVEAMTGETTLSTLRIDNVGACSASSYLPYTLASAEGLEANAIGDQRMPAAATKLVVTNGGIPAWFQAQRQLVETQQQESVQTYLSLEGSFREYVYSRDLQLTQAAKEVLDRALGGNEQALSMEEIQGKIYDYLNTHMSYEEEGDGWSGEDFASYVLEENPAGYSVHYATLAVLMLRYYGVPARYVEGYHLSREQAGAAKAGETILLTEEHAHAWAEYYLDGVGFVPFEVTPGYIDEEDLEEGYGGNAGGSRYQNQTNTKELEKPEVEEPDREEIQGIWWWLQYFAGMAGMALFLLLLVLLWNRRKLALFLRGMQEAEPKQAIPLYYSYAMRLKGQTDVCLSMDEEAYRLNGEARFSDHTMDETQKTYLRTYQQEVLKACKAQWSLGQKFKLRFFKNLY